MDEHLSGADLVVTGEGFLDSGSFDGKVVGGVHRWATAADVPVVAVVGAADETVNVPTTLEVRSLTDRYGQARSFEETTDLVAAQVTELLAAYGRG